MDKTKKEKRTVSKISDGMKKDTRNYIPDKIYKEILTNIPFCAVDIVFLNKAKNKTLLFKRKNEPAKGIYFTIGGRLHRKENLLECALRQAKTELNISLVPTKTVFSGIIVEHWKNSKFRVSCDNVCIFYSYILDDENITIKFDDQHSDYKWFRIDDSSLHPYIKEKIRQILLKNK